VLEELAAAAGLRTPPTRVLTVESADRWDGGFPAVVKPVSSYVPQADGTMKHGRAWDGEVVAVTQKPGDRTWPCDGGVLSYGRIVGSDPDLDRSCREMIAEARWSGLFNLQFLDAPGGRFLIDFNPRAWNSLAVQVEAGANMPAAWVDLLLGRPVRPAVPPARPPVSLRDRRRAIAVGGMARRAALRGCARASAPMWHQPRDLLVDGSRSGSAGPAPARIPLRRPQHDHQVGDAGASWIGTPWGSHTLPAHTSMSGSVRIQPRRTSAA
jgi:hypothetical protein